uniref:Uncharacterized protein n=1 Tax=Arundo donax TaxID=35708 RepID=A0A0A9A216_ARUDO
MMWTQSGQHFLFLLNIAVVRLAPGPF